MGDNKRHYVTTHVTICATL